MNFTEGRSSLNQKNGREATSSQYHKNRDKVKLSPRHKKEEEAGQRYRESQFVGHSSPSESPFDV